jgi:hypothetical protein
MPVLATSLLYPKVKPNERSARIMRLTQTLLAATISMTMLSAVTLAEPQRKSQQTQVQKQAQQAPDQAGIQKQPLKGKKGNSGLSTSKRENARGPSNGRVLGRADGTGTPTRPRDGSGYGSLSSNRRGGTQTGTCLGQSSRNKGRRGRN